MSLTFIFDAIRALLSQIDKMAYWFLDKLISLFDTIASIRIFTDPVIAKFATRIFVFISIIMIFKVSFSIIQYIINPDAFNDKEKGMGNVIKNVLLTLVSLVFVQHIFNFAYEVQGRILSENVIPNVILGVQNVDEAKQKEVKSSLPMMILNAFFVPNTQLSEITYENDMYYCGDGINPMYEASAGSSVNSDTLALSYSKNRYNTSFGACLGRITNDSEFNVSKYNTAMESNDYRSLLDNATIKSSNPDVYLFDYKMFVSTIAVVFMIIIYLNFCIDLAIRSAKLGFLQLIAPIPIISMVDPKSSKSGMMSKWVKQCLSTYAGLFIRVAAVNFVIYIMYIIMDPNFFSNIDDQSGGSIFAKLLIIFGAFMFAKELPKLISDLTGIDFKGDFKLNPLKRIPAEISGVTGKLGAAVGTAAIGGVAGAASGIASKARLAGQNYRFEKGAGFKKNAWTAVKGIGSVVGGGLVGGTVSGLGSGAASGFKNGKVTQSVKNGREVGQKIAQTNYKYDGTNVVGRTVARVQNAVGVQTDAERTEATIKSFEEYAGFLDQMKAQADFNDKSLDIATELSLTSTIHNPGNANNRQFMTNINDASSKGVKGLKEFYERLQQTGNATDEQLKYAKEAWESAQGFVITHANETRFNNSSADQIVNIKAYAARYAKSHNFDKYDISINPDEEFSVLKSSRINANNNASTLKYSKGYQKDKATADAVNNKK